MVWVTYRYRRDADLFTIYYPVTLARAPRATAPDWAGNWTATRLKRRGRVHTADPAAREWLFDIYAATLLQSIGRARGINHDKDEPLEIRLYGCLINPGMDAALSRSMITISDTTKYSKRPAVPPVLTGSE